MRTFLVLSLVVALPTTAAAFSVVPEKPKAEQRREVNPQALADFTSTVLEAAALLQEHHIKPVSQGQLVDWAIRGLYQSVEEGIPDFLAQRLQAVLEGKEKLKGLLTDARKHLGERPELGELKDIDQALTGMLKHLEPETKLEPQREERSRQPHGTPGNYVGIGLQLQIDPGMDQPQVVTTFKDGPAHRAKVMSGDVIAKIVSERGPEVLARSTKGVALVEVERALLGPLGSQVKLTLQRGGVVGPVELTLARGRVEPEIIFGSRRKEDDNFDFMLDSGSKIAYIRIPGFHGYSTRELKRALADVEKQQMRGLILDLRFNTGGLLTKAVEAADLFLGEGIILTIKSRDIPIVYEATRKNRLDFPLVCLVNGVTASTSESLAACLQDHRRGVIVGERTRGETGYQSHYDLNGGDIHFTTALSCRPSGKNLAKMMTSGKEAEDWGVVPDRGFAVPLTLAERTALREHLRHQEIIPRRDRPTPEAAFAFKDRQLDKALIYLRQELKWAK